MMLCGAPAARAQAEEASLQRILNVGGVPEIRVATHLGAIVVRGGVAEQVEVRAWVQVLNDPTPEEAEQALRNFLADPPVVQSGDVITIGPFDRDLDPGGLSVSYELHVPPETTIQARSGRGDIRIDSLERPGDVILVAGSGAIQVSGPAARLQARAGRDAIVVDGLQTGSWELEAGAGDITVRLPETAGFRFEASAGRAGAIHIAHPLTLQGDLDRQRLTGSVRHGGPLLRASAARGRIRIE